MKGFGVNKNNNLRKLYNSRNDKNLYLKDKLTLAKNYIETKRILLAEKIYAQLIQEGVQSYDLFFSYALLSRNNLKFKVAKSLLNKSISKYPTKVDQYILLAEICRLEKKFPIALDLLLIARKINPRNANTLYNLSLLYRDLDSKENSLSNVNQAIRLSPNNYVYKLLKADLLKEQSNFEGSRLLLKELYSNKNIKDKKDILLMLSTVERLDSNLLMSEEILLETIKFYPKFSQAYLNLSDLYFEQKLSIKAKEILLRGLEIKSTIMPEMYVNLGIISRSLGEINEAKKNLLIALSINKNLYKCYMNLSTFYDFAENPDELNHLMNMSTSGINEDDKARVYFSRGNIFHRQKEFCKASENYQSANVVKSKLQDSNKDYLIEKGNKIKDKYHISNVDILESNSKQELIFIVGMPRSGSTLLENILSINNEVIDLGEIEILPNIMRSIDVSTSDNNPYQSYISELNKIHPHAKIVTDKNLFNYIYTPVINRYFKNSKIIFCLRNPLDNILSIFRSNFTEVPYSSNIKDITELYIYHYELMKLYSKSCKNILFTYNYDELVVSPSKQIKKIIDWLGWKWSDEYLSPHKNKRQVFTASSEQVRNPISKSSLEGWKNYKDLLKPACDLILNNSDLSKYLET